ncbi:cupin domain-containing protein [Chryseobacterium nematophagum]|uniref:hypothetical protein n=1 Tax=Chryseobacterium nematophagum TaxID=2305228 RepID=UPI001E3003E7|nr:hypothetical protein [Chryseobacterium nematophagum]
MKIQEEKIIFDEGLSFRLSFPSLRNCFYWHYHPEIELVYVEAANGIRHVGKHISDFTGSDLVLIGSNVPHLNFDYGIKTNYYQVVIQMRTQFFDNIIKTVPELNQIKTLLDRSFLGLSFGEETKKEVAIRLKKIKKDS